MNLTFDMRCINANPQGGICETELPFAGGAIDVIVDTVVCVPKAVVEIIPGAGISQADVDIAIAPRGTGAFSLDVPDNLVPGGNCRGDNAVDLQMTRISSTQVASGTNSAIGGGGRNTANGPFSVIGGGFQNTTNGDFSFIGGGNANITNNDNTMVGCGNMNTASGNNTVIAGGENNIASANNSFIGGGQNNTASNTFAVVGGGSTNTASGLSSIVCGGTTNRALIGNSNAVVGGMGNTVDGTGIVPSNFCSIVGGLGNRIGTGSSHNFIGGGSTILIDDATSNCGICAGSSNTIHTSSVRSFIGAGTTNNITAQDAFIGSGQNNTVIGSHSVIGGGLTNSASALRSTIVGGTGNTISVGGTNSCIVGGSGNTAGGVGSLVGGIIASDGGFSNCFVFSDALGLTATDASTFNVGARGLLVALPGAAPGSSGIWFDIGVLPLGSFPLTGNLNVPTGCVSGGDGIHTWPYTVHAGVTALWAPAPFNQQDAIDRLAESVSGLLGGPIP